MQRGHLLLPPGVLSADTAPDRGAGLDLGGDYGGADRPEGSEWRWPLIGGMLLGSVLIAASIYLSYRFAERIGRTLGDAAMNVIIRLSSFILVCIGVQIVGTE